MVLETTFRTATGTAVLVDALAVGPNERGHELGAGAPSALLRRVTGVEGTLDLDVEYAPRPGVRAHSLRCSNRSAAVCSLEVVRQF